MYMELREFLEKYDCIFFDQFGVLHNGKEALSGSIELLNYLKSNNKKLGIISNSSSRKKSAMQKFKIMGFPPIETFITSGELTYNFVKNNYKNKNAVIFTWENEYSFFHNLSINPTHNPHEADFLLIHGTEITYSSDRSRDIIHEIKERGAQTPYFERISYILRTCAKRKLIAICANPDIIVRSGDEKYYYMPGFIAKMYEEHGGKVIYFGKPHKSVFDEACHQLNVDTSVEKCIHIGDSLIHDINGAHNSYIDSLLITKHGIHKDECYLPHNTLVNNVKILCLRENVNFPSYVCETLDLRAKATKIIHNRTR